jgi:hypothetical protein
VLKHARSTAECRRMFDAAIMAEYQKVVAEAENAAQPER